MPGRDGTGPQGRGPLTGGGWGPCGAAAGRQGRGGFGRARGGRGRGWGRGAAGQDLPFDPLATAGGRAEEEGALRRAIEELQRRLERLIGGGRRTEE